jgi:glycosyltransferase involved in cell wall biosynthesis
MTEPPSAGEPGPSAARLRIALVAPVATSVPPPRSGSIETMTSLLADGLADRGHEVTLFAVATSATRARLEAMFTRGYRDHAPEWPWELMDLFNLSAAVRRADAYDVIHCQSEAYPVSLAFEALTATPLLHTVHYSPAREEILLWRRAPDAPFVALSEAQARHLAGVRVMATIPHGVDLARFDWRPTPGDYLLFLGRFTAGKGVLAAIEIARRTGLPLKLAAQENPYYREHVAPHVDGRQIEYVGEVGHAQKVALLGGARALLYPVLEGEPFGLVLAEAMACGTPVAALAAGAVREFVDDGVTGVAFDTLDALVDGLPGVFALNRAAVRRRAETRFDANRMVDAYVDVYRRLVTSRGSHEQQR